VLAGLAAGNAVIAKPAEQTALIATRAVELMHEAGMPREAIQLLPGSGSTVGAAADLGPAHRRRLLYRLDRHRPAHQQGDGRVHAAPDAPLMAETGGLNAMIVDSTALPEQAVRDIWPLPSRAPASAAPPCACSMCRRTSPNLLEMLFGAMDELRLGDPWQLDTDVAR
jgi:RHH-type transcriptional regulator, proline utilization regulon repressor / proline dehydrogenase / delta 1-pyrroline-5-carboxylate dehydrogenase